MLIAVALVGALVPGFAQARVGVLDPSFGEGGRVTTVPALSLAVASDGSIVLDGGRLLARYLPDGSLDPSFGEGGTVRLPETLEGLEFRRGVGPGRMAVDSQGRVLIFGEVEDREHLVLVPNFLLSTPESWGAVMRLTPSGQLDPSFGEGKGLVRSDFGVRPKLETELPTVSIVDGWVDSEDRPVFVADVAGLSGRCNYGHTSIVPYPRAVVRLTATGALDPSFAGGGVSPIPGAEGVIGAALDSDQPVVAVNTEKCRKGGNRVIRLGTDGEPLASFGTGGSRYYPGLYFRLLASGGAMIFSEGLGRYVRVEANGAIDKDFGKKGTAVEMPAGVVETLRPAFVDPQGRIILVGTFSLPKPHKHPHRGSKHRHRKRQKRRRFFAIGRLLANGRLDRSFGNRGWIVTEAPRAREVHVDDAALDAEGRLLVAVRAGNREILARYLLGN